MTDKEMIEEMVSIIFRTEFVDTSYYEAGKIAEELIKHYQPKLPEGSVVLTREEYDEIKIYQSYIPEMKKAFDKVRNATLETCKDEIEYWKSCCKEIGEGVVRALEERKERVKVFYSIAESVGVDIAIRTVKELVKQYGVEVD